MRYFCGYLLSLVLPLCTLFFLQGMPYSGLNAFYWTLPVWLIISLDYIGYPATTNPPPGLPSWPFDILLLSLTGLQLANILLMLQRITELGWDTPLACLTGLSHLITMRILVGTSSCCCGIAVAHELIHRRERWQKMLGRLLLLSVCYDHFFVEHVRGHHRHVGTSDDPATAQRSESYHDFWQRTVRAQWHHAWISDRQGVLIGMMMQAMALTGIIVGYGFLALFMFLWQALAAVRLLEAVNYFQHWALQRTGEDTPRPAWVTDSALTLYTFIGLSRHIDHHNHAGKPFYRLEYRNDGPRLPYGYFAMALLVKLRNAEYRRLASEALRVHPGSIPVIQQD